uniref:G protein-coupled receptor n=1 Tax=Heterorhabditis bacteriophora TaxID=37862 RepID=A0A1I7W6R3_HETBA
MSSEVPTRAAIDDVEIVYLSIIVTAAVILNTIVLTQLLTTSNIRMIKNILIISRAPTVRTSFSTGPYQLSSFTQFKLSLCITDFAILLIYALGKVSETLDSNYFLYFLPQAFVWRTLEVSNGWHQCTTIFAVSTYSSNMILSNKQPMTSFIHINRILSQIYDYTNTTTEFIRRVTLFYELSHQATVFWIPFSIILVSYLLIVLKLLHYTFRPRDLIRISRGSDSDSIVASGHEKLLFTIPKLRITSAITYFNSIDKKRKPSALSPGRKIYYIIISLRFVDFNAYKSAMQHGANFLEDLIVRKEPTF